MPTDNITVLLSLTLYLTKNSMSLAGFDTM